MVFSGKGSLRNASLLNVIWPCLLLLLSAAVYELHEIASVLFYIALKILAFLSQVEAKKGMQVEAGGGTRREESEDQQENRPYF